MNEGKTGGEKWWVKDDGRVFDLLPTIFHQLSLCVKRTNGNRSQLQNERAWGHARTALWVILYYPNGSSFSEDQCRLVFPFFKHQLVSQSRLDRGTLERAVAWIKLFRSGCQSTNRTSVLCF